MLRTFLVCIGPGPGVASALDSYVLVKGMMTGKTMNRLYWITGLAGAGKTTIARALVDVLHSQSVSAVLLDGDELREAFAMTDLHSPEDRLRLANCYARLGRLLHVQGLNVVCATISPFPEVRQWLRANVPGYVEVYVRVSTTTLNQRDKKGLFSGADRRDIANVVGRDIPFVVPAAPDVVIDNEPGTSIDKHVQRILHCEVNPLCYSA